MRYWIKRKNVPVFLGAIVVLGVGLFVFIHTRCVAEQPNILLISIDALRPDYLGCYNSDKDVSPNIDTIAEQGCLFISAIWSYASLLQEQSDELV